MIFLKENRRQLREGGTKIFPISSHDKNVLIGKRQKRKKTIQLTNSAQPVRSRNRAQPYMFVFETNDLPCRPTMSSGYSLYGRLSAFAQWASVIRPETTDEFFSISRDCFFLPRKTSRSPQRRRADHHFSLCRRPRLIDG